MPEKNQPSRITPFVLLLFIFLMGMINLCNNLIGRWIVLNRISAPCSISQENK